MQSKWLKWGHCWQKGILVLSVPERGERTAREGEEDVKPRYYEVVGHMAEQTTAIQHLLTDTNHALGANG
ncbi:MAG: hypothetical protein PHG39_03405 [Acidithiobacillus ferrooxidans]|nr:hypothetical protein [Acidithiobacillus ferrooxidans]MDD5004044.1 hypothetical protein [Acidithiobacillus sp.]MDD5377680.1 hypothetical protein [Acidithiobacillus sp.]MDD5577269.1 hypothetical protein [Acidithiobacillus sp.]